MKLPNAEHAAVAIETLRDYCLNPEHLRGRHKARVFAAALGITAEDADWLRTTLLDAARDNDAILGERDETGSAYTVISPWKDWTAES